KLFGREKEIDLLNSLFKQVSLNRSELLLIKGLSGIGKTSLVLELQKNIIEKKGYFLSGKFDQFNKNVPYKAIKSIFQDLIKQILSESEEKLINWKEKLLKQLDKNAILMVDLIPELEFIIGKQKPVIELSPGESWKRFNLIFQNFIKVIINKDNPVVIFLDDLQWADHGSLELLEILADSNLTGLLLIGSYRDNEINSTHPVFLMIERIQNNGMFVNSISLGPLQKKDINNILKETLKSNEKSIKELVEMVYSKTGGNPFFVNEFLKSLYSENLFQFNYEENSWKWDLDLIKKRNLSENVVDIIIEKVKKLPRLTQKFLRIAACFGSQFDLNLVSLISDDSIETVRKSIKPALLRGYIIYMGSINNFKLPDSRFSESGFGISKYKFSHDKIRQSIYTLIPERKKNELHFIIGKSLDEHFNEKQKEENIFLLVNQLNYGIENYNRKSEIIKLATYNYKACLKARSSNAYSSALEYSKIGISLLIDYSWEEFKKLKFDLYLLGIEVALLSGNINTMEEWTAKVLENSSSPLDYAGVYIYKIQALASMNKLQEAIDTGVRILSKLGIEFPKSPERQDFVNEIREIKELIGNKNISELYSLPKMQDKEKLAIINISAALIPACYNAGSPLFPLLIFLQVKKSILFGNSPVSHFGYTNLGIIINNITKEILLADEFRKLAFQLALLPESKSLRAATYTGSGLFLIHRTNHIKDTIPVLNDGIKVGLETGLLEFVGYCIYALCVHKFWMGDNLFELKRKIIEYKKSAIDYKLITQSNYCAVYLDSILRLTGNIEIKEDFYPLLEEGIIINEAEKSGDKTRLFHYFINRMVSSFYLGIYEDSEKYSILVRQNLGAGVSSVSEAGFYFFDSLVRLKKLNRLNLNETEIINHDDWKIIILNQEELKVWADFAPMNYLNKWSLVEAEKHSLLKNKQEADNLYFESLKISSKSGFIQEEALGNELMIGFCLKFEREEYAKIHLKKAHYLYSLWGAEEVLKRLEEEFSLLDNFQKLEKSNIVEYNLPSTISITTTSNRKNTNSSNLDIFTILKSSQAISEEIKLESLIEKIMKIMVENAGAQKGVFLLNSDKWFIKAIINNPSENVEILENIPLDTLEDENMIPLSLIHYSIRTNQSVLLDNVSKDKRFLHDPYIKKNSLKSTICEPIQSHGDFIGLLYLENNLLSGAFTPNHLEILKILSSQIAISIENAGLYKQMEVKVKKRTKELNKTLEIIKQDMLLAKKIQENTLPIDFSLIEELKIYPIYIPMAMVGGDFYGITKVNDSKYRFFLSDATGHGVQAAMITMAIKGIFDNLKNNDIPPGEIIEIFNNEYMNRYDSLNCFITCILIDIDVKEKKLFYASAGHPPSVLIKNNKLILLERTGKLIGVLKNNIYKTKEMSFSTGDKLFCFTDGIFEE
ncbi:MAG: AAA family ATPase, partial [Leptospiraceae bacterium]|nr:AAA family ATPase [Leptospiraceae bacterium]